MSAPEAQPAPIARTHLITPPSARVESWAVARALFHIAYWSALLVSAQTYVPPWRADAAPVRREPSPFERRFQDLPPADQRIFRSLQEGVAEAERVRSATGRWPSVDTLATKGVPPFAPDPIDRARYAWLGVQTGTRVDYIGTPAVGSGREAFFAVIVEPEPGTAPDPLVSVDEVHHRLDDGTMIHVTLWMGPPLADTSEAFALLPPERGYRQVLSGTTGGTDR